MTFMPMQGLSPGMPRKGNPCLTSWVGKGSGAHRPLRLGLGVVVTAGVTPGFAYVCERDAAAIFSGRLMRAAGPACRSTPTTTTSSGSSYRRLSAQIQFG